MLKRVQHDSFMILLPSIRTHETLANIKKDPHSEGLFVNGALNGMISEPQPHEIFFIMDTEESQILYRRMEKLLAA